MTDTLQAPALPSEPPTPHRNAALPVLAILAGVVLAVVAVVATRDDSATVMGPSAMPGSMSSNGQMMNGSTMGNGMMGNGMMSNGMMGNGMMGNGMMGNVSPSPTIAGAREISVAASAFRFVPAEIHVRAGEDVTIVLTATDTTHDFTIDELGFRAVATLGQVGQGSFHAPSTAGRYTAYCSVAGHRQAGMTATVVVDPT